MPEHASPPAVLVVEDDDNIATALGYVLQKAGHPSTRIARGSDAMPAVHRLHPRLILLDISLPERSGYDICDDIRRDPALARTRILMMTARGSATEQRRALEHGADGFVAKPFDLTFLRAEISRLLDSSG